MAYKGVGVDGHDFIEQAIKNGAMSIVGEKESKITIPYIKVDNARLVLAKMWAKWENDDD